MDILYNAVCIVLYFYALFLGQCSKNALKLPRLGSSIITIISLNLAVSHFQRPSRYMYVKAYSKVDLLLENNFSVIAKMGCSDAPKPIVNAFLRPSIIFFPTVLMNYKTKLPFHPYKPVSWLPTHQGIL